MKVTQEKLPASQIGLEIEIPPELSKASYEKVIREFSRTANIPGFRKGKVPRTVLLQRLGTSRVKAAAIEQMIQDCLEKAIEQENIEALGNYQLRSSFDELITQFEPGTTSDLFCVGGCATRDHGCRLQRFRGESRRSHL
jgi:trigger factor